MSRTDAQLRIRMPHKLRERIKIHADQNRRTANQEIVTTLEAAYPEPVSGELLIAAQRAERFIRGFEDDELQEGITELLQKLRSAIANAGGEPT